MKSLDDQAYLKEIDKSGMLLLTQNLPLMIRDSIKRCQTAGFSVSKKAFSNILVAGMGGSAISGDIFKNLLLKKAKIPVSVVRDYDIPSFVSSDTLVFILSYSGNTEETISAYKKSLSKKARTIVVTSGGKIKDMASKANDMIFSIPSGLPPRASLPYLLVPLLFSSDKFGVTKGLMKELGSSLKSLDKIKRYCSASSVAKNNPAKKLALSLKDKRPVILGISGSSDVAAYRWKCQFSENSKITSVANCFPEMNHNEIVNLAEPKSRIHNFAAIILRGRFETERIKKRINTTKKLISKNVSLIEEIETEEKSLLTNILSLCYLGDFVSVYLAILNGTDPTPVMAIDRLKMELLKK